MATLNGIDLGNVQTISRSKSANLLPIGSGDTQVVFDLIGNTKVLTATGTFTGTTAEVKTFTASIRELIDGFQTSNVAFVSAEEQNYDSGSGTYSDIDVKVNTFDHRWDGVPSNRISYTLTMIEADS